MAQTKVRKAMSGVVFSGCCEGQQSPACPGYSDERGVKNGGAEDEQSLLDHQEWCLGDGVANTQLLSAVAERDGELTQEALVAAAKKRRGR